MTGNSRQTTEYKPGGWLAKELAQAAGLNPSRIRQLLIEGALHGEKRGPVWLISDSEAQRFLRDRKGR